MIPADIIEGETKSNVEPSSIGRFPADLPASPPRATGNRLALNPPDHCADMRFRRRFHRSGWK